MASLAAIIKNAEEIAVQEDEEIVEEEVLDEQIQTMEVNQMEWMGATEIMEQRHGGGTIKAMLYQNDQYYQNIIEQHQNLEQMADYEDADQYHSFLPIRDGAPFFSLNLPDLLSKPHQITQESGVIVRLISCFNKKCQRQVAYNGYLHTIENYVSDTDYNYWKCINDQCYGKIRTTPDLTEIREMQEHDCGSQDELQIAIRIAVYDARLLAEFTDTPLENLYVGAAERVKADCPDGFVLFPTFEVMKSTLEDHRFNKIYRKRFEMQHLKDKQQKLHMSPDEVLYAENVSGLIKFRRTKPFPPSICTECSDQFISTNLPSQDQLVAHYMYNHGRRLTIERFEFKDVSLFDQYLRELNQNSRYKMKRMGLADENMYYLCTHDDRLAKSGVGRASRSQEQHSHCTAFIRVFDWRIVSKREGSRITIDYCLEHQPHPYDLDQQFPRLHRTSTIASSTVSSAPKDYIDYYTPEVFAREIDERRQRTQKMIGDAQLGSTERPTIKCPVEVKQYVPPGKLKACFGTRALAPPRAAQIAGGIAPPYVDVFSDESRQRTKYPLARNIRTAFPKMQEEPVEASSSTPGPSSRPPENDSNDDPSIPPPRIYITQKPYTRMTERQNFKDIYTFNAICKVEDVCLNLLNRLQSCQHARIGVGYRDKISAILRNANTDPGLTDGMTTEEIEKSWVLQKPLRGRPKKRCRTEDEERGGGGEDDDGGDLDDFQEEDDSMDVEQEREKDEKPVVLPPISSSPKPPPSSEPPRVERTETAESSTSSTSSNVTPDATTRSGRARKPPARLVE